MEELPVSGRIHKIASSNRKSCSVTGVTDVISFDLNQVLLEPEYGMLTVDKGELEVDGTIDSYVYSEVASAAKKGESFLNRLFK